MITPNSRLERNVAEAMPFKRSVKQFSCKSSFFRLKDFVCSQVEAIPDSLYFALIANLLIERLFLLGLNNPSVFRYVSFKWKVTPLIF